MSEDFGTVREAISRRWGGDYRFPGMPEQLRRDANIVLDRIEARMGELQDEVRRLNTALEMLAAALNEREAENERLRSLAAAVRKARAWTEDVAFREEPRPSTEEVNAGNDLYRALDDALAALQGQEPTDG